MLIPSGALAWEPPAIFDSAWWQPVQVDFNEFPYSRQDVTAVLNAVDPGRPVTADQRGFLETQEYRGHMAFAPGPALKAGVTIGLVYKKRVSLEGGDWMLVEVNRSTGSFRELARAMTLLVRPIDLDRDGFYELHLTAGEIHAGYAEYRDSVLRWDKGAGYYEIFMVNSSDTSGVVPRHPTVDRDNRLIFADLNSDGVLDMTVLTKVTHIEARRPKDPAALALTEYEAIDYLYGSGGFAQEEKRQVGTVLPPQ